MKIITEMKVVSAQILRKFIELFNKIFGVDREIFWRGLRKIHLYGLGCAQLLACIKARKFTAM